MADSTVAKAAKEADRAWQALVSAGELEAQWRQTLAERQEALEELRKQTGGLLLEDPDAAEELAERETKLVVAERQAGAALAEAAARMGPARSGVLTSRAQIIDARAAAMEQAAVDRQAKTEAMLAQVSQWEGGARYVAYEPTSQDLAVGGGSVTLYGHRTTGIRYRIPLTETIRRAAADLRAQAEQLRGLAQSGSDEAVAAVIAKPLPQPSDLERQHAGIKET